MDIGIGFGIDSVSGGWNLAKWTALFDSIGYSHPMLPNLWLKKESGTWVIQSHTIDDFRTIYANPVIKYVNWSTGVDTNNGDTPATAYKTITKLNGVTYDRAYIASGNYASSNSTNIFTNTREIFGTGGIVTVMRGITGENLTWTDDGGGMFHASTTLAPASVVDDSQTTAGGEPLAMVAVANSGLVASTLNSYYKDSGGGVIYVHQTNGLQPSNNFYFSTTYVVALAGKTCYAENVRFMGLSCTNATATKNVILLKNCQIVNSSSNGFAAIGNVWSWFEDCLVSYSKNDGFNYSISGAYNPSSVEVGTITRYNGSDGTSSNNGSSGHDSSIILRVNGNHTHAVGPCLHEVHFSKSYNIGCTVGFSDSIDPTKKSAYATGGGTGGETSTLWLHDCINTDSANTYGAENRTLASALIYVKNSNITNVKPSTVLINY